MTLYQELIEGPLAAEIAPFIAAGNDGAINAILTRKDIAVYGSISVNAFAIWAAKTGLRAAIQDHAYTLQSPLRSIALTLLDFLQSSSARSLDFGNSDNCAMLEAWVVAGALTPVQRDDLLAMALTTISRAEQQGVNADIAAIAHSLRS